MNNSVDIVLYARNGQPMGVVDIMHARNTSHTWATQTRKNIVAHGDTWDVVFYLIVTPDRLYLWKNAGTNPTLIPPTYEVDMQSEFAPYFKSTGLDPNHIGRHAFELLAGSWLSEVTRLKNTTEEFTNERSWLNKSGLWAAIKGGRIKFDVET